MVKYEATVIGNATGRRLGNAFLPSRMASIVVKPPIEVGPAFNDVVLGFNPTGIILDHVVSTDEHTLFIAETSRINGDRELQHLATRIGNLANYPEVALDQSQDRTFTV